MPSDLQQMPNLHFITGHGTLITHEHTPLIAHTRGCSAASSWRRRSARPVLRLHNDYAPDGRVLGEVFNPADLPSGMRSHRGALLRLGQLYTQLEAPVGTFGKDTLRASTRALASSSPGDATYTKIESALQRLGARRDAVASRIDALLLGAAFDGRPLNVAEARALTRQGERVLGAAAVLGARS